MRHAGNIFLQMMTTGDPAVCANDVGKIRDLTVIAQTISALRKCDGR